MSVSREGVRPIISQGQENGNAGIKTVVEASPACDTRNSAPEPEHLITCDGIAWPHLLMNPNAIF